VYVGQNFVWVGQARVWVGHGLIARTASGKIRCSFITRIWNRVTNIGTGSRYTVTATNH